MQLKQLNALIEEYKGTIYLRKLYHGDHRRAQKLEDFVGSLKQDPDYLLTTDDEFALACLLSPMEDDLLLVKQFKALFNNSSRFFELFNILHSKGLINQANFFAIHGQDLEHIDVLHQLFCNEFKREYVTEQILDAVLVILEASHFPRVTGDCFSLLHSRGVLNNGSLQLVKKNAAVLPTLLLILKGLATLKQLNAEHIKELLHYNNLYYLSLLLPLITQAKILFDPQLHALINQPSISNEVINCCSILIKHSLLDLFYLKFLLGIKEQTSFRDLHQIVVILEKEHLLHKEILDIVSAHSSFSLYKIINLLAEHHLLDAMVVKKLIDLKLDLFSFYHSAKALADLKVLNQETIALILLGNISEELKQLLPILAVHVPLDSHLILRLSYYKAQEISYLGQIVSKLEEKKLLDGAQLSQLLNLGPDYYKKFLQLVGRLERHAFLDKEHLTLLFKKLRHKVTMPEPEGFTIENQINPQGTWLRYHATKGAIALYASESSQLNSAGGRAKITPASKSTEGAHQYSIKKLNSSVDYPEKEARRETKYARLLGRESFFFQHNSRWHIVSEWQTGEDLGSVQATGILNTLSLKDRLRSLFPLFKDLGLLHAEFRVHGDIKCQNCVFDRDKMELKLIDFGSTRKVKQKNYPIAWTPHYLDKYMSSLFEPTNYYSFNDDIYALGIVVASLFPDIFLVTIDRNNTQVSVHKEDSCLTIQEKSIIAFVSSMLSIERDKRCTADIAFSYLRIIVDNFEQMDESFLQNAVITTLNKKECSFEDILHDRAMAP